MVTTENYEEYMMLDADGELDSVAKEALLTFLAANPELMQEYSSWRSLKLQPDVTLAYPEKQALLKEVPAAKVLTLRSFILTAAAAVLLAVVFIPTLLQRDKPDVRVVHQFSPGRTPVSSVKATPAPTERPATGEGKGHAAAQAVAAQRTPQGSSPAQAPAQAQVQDELVAELYTDGPRLRVAASSPQPLPLRREIAPELVTTLGQQEPVISHVELAPANKMAFDILKQAVQERIEQASLAAKSIRETALVIRLGNGSVNLNF